MNPETASYVSLAVAIIGIPLAFFIARYFSARPRLDFAFEHEKIFDSSESEASDALVIRYKDEEIRNFHRWKFGIWNPGNQTFDSNSFIESDQLKIAFEGHRVLDIQTRHVSRKTVAPEFVVEDGRIVIPRFEVCDRTDGYVFSIFTEKLPSEGAIEDSDGKEKDNLSFSGSLKGLPSGLRKAEAPVEMQRSDSIGILALILLMFAVGTFFGNEMIQDWSAYAAGDERSTLLLTDSTLEAILLWGGQIFLSVLALIFVVGAVLGAIAMVAERFRVPIVIRTGFHETENTIKSPVKFVSGMLDRQ